MSNGLSIKAQCTIFKNEIQINCKKKSKLSSISISEKQLLMVIIGKGENQTFKFPINKLKSIHKKFIDEGKITVEFNSHIGNGGCKNIQLGNDYLQNDGSYQIFISNACKQNLQAFVNQIVNLKKKLVENKEKKTNANQKIADCQEVNRKKKLNEQFKPQLYQQYKPPDGAILRKKLLQLCKMQQKGFNKKQVKKVNSDQIMPKVRVNLLALPKMLIRHILSYSGINLSQRIISKQFDEIVVKSITYLRLQEQIEEQFFNKIAKWAINLEGRFKNVKTIKLDDRYDDHQLKKNRAKSLYFSQWKQLSSKHINQLKGLRIYCLEIPYSIKFQFSHLFGLRLVQLRLKGKTNVKNSMVKDEDITYFVNNVSQLKVIEVSYISTKFLAQIKNPQKMQQIKIGILNRVGSNQDWANLRKFINLKTLSISDTHKFGVPDDHENLIQDIKWPENVTNIQIGCNLSQESRSSISTQLKYLKLLGAHVKNSDVDHFYLPALYKLDISECPNLTPQCLQNMANLNVITNWNRNQVQYASKFYSIANISISSIRGFSYC